MNKTKIEWCDYTWNPIKGLCPQGCWYCYARRIYERFKLDPRLEFSVIRGEIGKMDRLKPSRIFVCSTMEMFHPQVKPEWRDKIFQTFGMFPKHTFIVLTKCPELIDRPMPPNVWLGASVTAAKDAWRIREIYKIAAEVRFVSLEPLFEFPGDADWSMLDWLIVGRLTGHGHKHDPTPDVLHHLDQITRLYAISLFMKNSLAGIWPGELIQEFPHV